MLKGNESLEDIYRRKSELESEIKKLHGPARRE
jgi:hypothetical protein